MCVCRLSSSVVNIIGIALALEKSFAYRLVIVSGMQKLTRRIAVCDREFPSAIDVENSLAALANVFFFFFGWLNFFEV